MFFQILFVGQMFKLFSLSGTLLSGACVQAKHPEKGTFHEAIINKIQVNLI